MKFLVQPLYSLLRKSIAHPKYRWWIVLGSLIYLLNPLDVVPDVVPVLGEIDDAVLVTLVATELSQVLLEKAKSMKNRKSATPVAETV